MRRRRRGSLREPVSGGTARGRPSPSRAGSPGPTPARPTPSPFAARSWREAVEREYLLFFEHDPSMAAGYLREKDGKRFVERVI